MNESKDLGAIERHAYETVWKDGLLDLFVGLGMVTLAISWVTGHSVYGAVLPALLVPLWQPTRKRIVEPRAGYVEFGPARKAREKRSLGVIVAFGGLTLALGLAVFFVARESAPLTSDPVQLLIPALPAVLLAVGGALVGWLFGIDRFWVYSVLLLLGAGVGAAVGARPGWHFLAPGAVILTVGVSLLVSFLRRYPLAEAEELS